MAVAVGLALGDNLAAVVVHVDAHIAQGLAALERLSENVQAVAVTVYRQTDITEGEQGSWLRVAVGPRSAHDRQINTRLLQGFDTGNRQQQGLTGIARRLEIETAAVDQFGHGQQFFGAVAGQARRTVPLGEEVGHRVGFDAEEFDIHLVDVQGDDWQALGQPRRQQAATAGEAYGGLQVTGFQTADVFGRERGLVDGLQTGIDGQHQFALRLKVAQAQFHEVVRQLPGTVDLAVLAVHQMKFFAELLLRVERHGKAHRQGACAVDLDFRHVDDGQFAPCVALAQRGEVDCGFGLCIGNRCLGRCCSGWRRFIRGGGITGAQQRKRASQKQSFVEHGGTHRQR